MPIEKKLKQNLAKTNAFEKKHNEFLKGIKEFDNNKELQYEYRHVQDALIEEENENMRDSWEETVSRINDELEEMRALKTKEGRKAYAQACGIVSRKYKMPFELCLAVGAKNVEVLAKHKRRRPTKAQYWALDYCGIDRRKSAIFELIGEELFRKLDVEWMNQINSKRLGDWLKEPADGKYEYNY
ncbi:MULTISPECIES: hypothetical protein [Bacillus]|uniref:hypothetical protein n=2 Tax=Bacillaceae TaxID=186817 RepID=UPI001C238D47|nr:hypothetical protein [Bacillus pumilus]MBU8573732.1 hypothetical protein [Bacillus pumilus]